MSNICIGDKIKLKRFKWKYTVTLIVKDGVFATGKNGNSFYNWEEIE